MSTQSLSSFLWSVADLLRGRYSQADYRKVILPFTVLRRLDCVLEPTKAAVLAELARRTSEGVPPDSFLLRKSGQSFYNTSPYTLKTIMGDQDHIHTQAMPARPLEPQLLKVGDVAVNVFNR